MAADDGESCALQPLRCDSDGERGGGGGARGSEGGSAGGEEGGAAGDGLFGARAAQRAQD